MCAHPTLRRPVLSTRLAATALAVLALAPSASAEEGTAGPMIDHGFSFQTIDWSGVSETGGTPNPKSDWTLKASYRIWGTFPDRSVLRYIIKQKGKSLGEVRCETRSLYNAVVKRGRPHLFAENCSDRNLKFREAGEYQLEWHLVDGDTDADTQLGTDTMIVRAAPRYDIGATTRPWYPVMYPERHGEILATVLYQRQGGMPGYLSPLESPSLKSGDGIDIIVQASPSYSGDDPTNNSYVRCRVDGAAINLKTPWESGPMSGTTTDGVWASSGRGILAEAQTPNPSGNPRVNTDSILFRTWTVQLPLVTGVGTPKNDKTPIGNHPGLWECDWRSADGRTLRTFRFAVTPEGRVAPHEEQVSQGLTLSPDAVFVETVIPGDSPLDERTLPSVAVSGAFGGRGLKGPAAQALGKGVPAKGTPLPPKYVVPAGAGKKGR